MTYKITSPEVAGILPIANTDAGVSTAGGTTIPSPPLRLGMIVCAVDPTYGEGEFILLAGVASTAVGSVVTYNTASYTTTLAAPGSNIPQPIAVAMSANTSSSTWGWYQISGMAVGAKSTASLVAGTAFGVSATGVFTATASGAEVQGGVVSVTATASAGTVTVTLNRPHLQGRIT